MPWHDASCDTVYLTAALHRHPHVFEELHRHLQDHGIDIYTVFDTDNVWIRDYFPIKVGSRYVKFHYGYGEKVRQYPQLGVPPFCYAHLQPEMSGLGLDGGNVVRYGDRAIVTDIVYLHNQWLTKKKLRAALEDVLDAEVIVIPKEPYEITGHADGMVRWIDDKTVFVNDTIDKKFVEKLIGVLARHGLECILFPCSYDKFPVIKRKEFYQKYPEADTFQPSPGWYINYLMVKGLIIVPSYGIEDDEAPVELLRKHFPDYAIEQAECYDVGYLGGGINCITWGCKGN
jgi:agmatine deiminase